MAEVLHSLRQSRRGLVGLAGAALVGVERGTDEVLAAGRGKKIFVFNPEWGEGQKVPHSTTRCPDGKDATHKKGGRCHGCKACHAHAKNKRFATREAAEQNRAHVGCLCAIESRLVSKKAFLQMFPTAGSVEFDLRW